MQEDIDWNNLLLLMKQAVVNQMSELGVSVIYGDLQGQGCCYVTTNDFAFLDKKHLIDESSLCVIHEEYDTDEDSNDRSLVDLAVYVRLGTTNTWLGSRMAQPETEDDEDGDAEWDVDEDELTSDEIISLPLSVARESGFGLLKNQNQRLEFVRHSIAKTEYDLSDYTLREIASRADSYYSLGVLPSIVKKMTQDGNSITDVAKSLGISKAKAEKALSAEIPDFIGGLLL